MNNLEKTIDEAIEFWKQHAERVNDRKDIPESRLTPYIVKRILTEDAKFESALYEIVTEKLEDENG
jgi:hypothetical protein